MRFQSRRERISLWLDSTWERIWLCRTKGQHREKFSSDGRCIRCGHQIR